MTRTEERLSDALHASADRVRDDRLRTLPAAGRTTKRARVWLIPVASAASVVLVIAAAVALVGGPRNAAVPGADRGGSGGTGITAAGAPKYFAFFDMPNEHVFNWR